MPRTTIVISDQCAAKMSLAKQKLGTTKSDLIEACLDRYLDEVIGTHFTAILAKENLITKATVDQAIKRLRDLSNDLGEFGI